MEQIILMLRRGQEVPQSLWSRITRNSIGLTKWYGTPELHQLHLTSDEAAIQILQTSMEHFEKILAEEWRHRQHHYSLEFRQRLHEHGGANKQVTKLLTGGIKKGKLIHEGREITSMQEQLRIAAEAWKHFVSQPPMRDDGSWKTSFPTTPLRGCTELPPITWQELKAKLKQMKTRSSPGPDGWRVLELRALPDRSLMQLCRLLNRMEAQQQVPPMLSTTWSALLPVTKAKASALDMRPIALASVIWRCYAGARCRALQDWMDTCMPDQLYAYRRGRSAGQAAMKLGLAVDNAALRGQQLHIISLDASKAFPAVSRWQLFHVMRKRGCSNKVLSTLESFYSHCTTVYRIMGKYITRGPAHPARGILQGCPLSVLCFSALQEPLIEFLQRYFPEIELAIYADDVSYWSTNKEMLQMATPHILRFYEYAGITLNPGKTQYWTLQQNEESFAFGETILQAAKTITILGHTFNCEGADQPEASAGLMSKLMPKLQKLKELPMTEDAKEHAVAAIIGAAAWYCPWIAICQGISLHGSRMALLTAIRPYLCMGPRAQSAAIALCTKFHAVDPFLAPCYKLAKLILPIWHKARSQLQEAVRKDQRPIGPITVFAKMLSFLNVKIINHGLQLINSEMLVMTDPNDTPKWRHSLRAFLRAAELLRGTAHRREFMELQSMPMDWQGSLKWHHSLKAGATRRALEWVITGGILTPARVSKKNTGEPAYCQICEDEIDDDSHRIAQCPRWNASRLMSDARRIPELTCTYLLGIYPAGHHCTQEEIMIWQSHLVRVAHDTHEDAHRSENRPTSSENQTCAFTKPSATQNSGPVRRRIPFKMRERDAKQDAGWIRRYEEGGQPRVMCCRCLRTAKLQWGQAFRRRHRLCGEEMRPMPVPKLPLPRHISLQRRAVIASKQVRFTLTCICGGSGAATNVRRFVGVHEGCGQVSQQKGGRPGRLSRGEKRVLDMRHGAQNDSALVRAKRARLLLTLS